MSLSQLPLELISQVIEHIPTAASVAHLAQADRRLNNHVKVDGWRAFKAARFPSFSDVPSSEDTARLLTGLSRNWDRRALYGLYLDPRSVINLRNGTVAPWRKPIGQTMGFQPSIDSTESLLGEGLCDRLETLAYSAGSQLVFRQRNYRSNEADHWLAYQPLEAREGADDITALKLLALADDGSHDPRSLRVLYGTAAGKLGLLEGEGEARSGEPTQEALEQLFRRSGNKVNSLDVSPSGELAAVALGSNSLLLGSLSSAQASSEQPRFSQTDIQLEDGLQRSRVWKTTFLDESTIAMGVGPCKYPVQVLRLGEAGLFEDSLRKFCCMNSSIPGTAKARSLSAYAITPLPSSSIASQAAGQVFLAGYYDGVIRVHDLRSPEEHVAKYFDAVDDGAIYSLATMARERLVAGSARHNMLKFFDLRVTGGRNYHYDASEHANNYNLYLHPKSEPTPRQGAARRGQSRQVERVAESPVYSLSIPSSTSSNIYAGVENDLIQLQFAKNPRNKISALTTQYQPPPMVPPPRRRRGRPNAEESQDRSGPDFLELAMYDHRPELGMRLKVQQISVDSATPDSEMSRKDPNLDDLWIDSSYKARDVVHHRWR